MIRIFFADKDQKVIDGLKTEINWNELGTEPVGEATDGTAALKSIREKRPDIVVSDIHLPGLSGLEILERFAKRYDKPEFIIFTSDNEFETVRSAMKFGAARYIVKPSNTEEISRNIKEVCDKVYEKIEKRKTFEADLEAVRQDIFQRLFFGEKNEDIYGNAAFLLEQQYDKPVTVIIMRAMNGISDDELTEFQKTVAPFLHRSGTVGIRIGDRTFAYIDVRKPEMGCNKIAEIATRYFTGVYKARVKSFDRLCDIYKTAVKTFSMPSERVRVINSETSERTLYSVDPDDVLGTLVSGTTEDALKKLGDDMSHFTDTENASAYASAMLISMCKTAKAAGINMESLFDDTLSAINNAYDVNTVELLCRECIELYVKLTEKVSDWENAAVSDEVVNYVLKHYNENITLSSISKSLHLNTGLVSKTIKNSTGMKFNSYLNFVRIRNAQRLLLTSSTKITNIAVAVGYNDYYYFISKFKSITGELPSEYRKNHDAKRGGE